MPLLGVGSDSWAGEYALKMPAMPRYGPPAEINVPTSSLSFGPAVEPRRAICVFRLSMNPKSAGDIEAGGATLGNTTGWSPATKFGEIGGEDGNTKGGGVGVMTGGGGAAVPPPPPPPPQPNSNVAISGISSNVIFIRPLSYGLNAAASLPGAVYASANIKF